MTEKHYDTRGAGVFLGGPDSPISPDTMAYWRRVGTGPAFVKLGKHVRYPESELVAHQERNRRSSTSEAA